MFQPRSEFRLPALMFVSDRTLFEDEWAMLDTLRAACWNVPPGNVLVQIREKTLDARSLLALTQAAVSVVRSSGHWIVVNDRMDVAKFAGADGVHLPEAGIAVEDVRAAWPSALVGRSCHSVDACFSAGRVDYVTLSPIFTTDSKPDAAALGPEVLPQALTAPVAVYALGGINEARAATLLASGVNVAMRGAWQKLAQ